MLYIFDDDKALIEIIPDRVVINDPKHETLVPPVSGLYEPIRFDMVNQTWFGITKDEFMKNHPSEQIVPNDTDRVMAQLTLQAAQQKVTQDKLNAQVLLEIAQLKEGGNN
ncbi:hypothetical protein [Latilactobacillus sakei]|uniref:hypothetical protein n=1 Tax=Latilactobacillus sakei TaxID=1599 RepID=UPI00345CD12E